ncbi:major facilitator superfamily domain-containing protein 10-like [Tubulanus polymorphus]|uniref:major facilitator superfamily domain-containing protein 10-like n=1 Tax=Tubulanus polymorphus TaxID=672921 RepID=UPI003DA631D4
MASLTASGSGTIWIVFISLIIDLIGFTVILPLLPAQLEYYGRQDEDNFYSTILKSVRGFRGLVGAPDTPRWNAVLFGGFIGSLFSMLQFVSSPLTGALSDVWGRKSVLIISMIGVAVSYGLWAVSWNFSWFVLARFIGGLSKGNVSLAITIITDCTSVKNRSKGMALIGIAFSLGFLIGPLCGAAFAKWSRSHQDEFFQAPALFALVLSLIDILFVIICLKESLPTQKRAASLSDGLSDASHLINPVSLFSFKAVRNMSNRDTSNLQRIGAVYFLYLLIFSGLEFTLTFLTHNRFQYDSMKQGKMFFFIGIVMATIQGGYVRRIKVGTEQKTALRGMVALVPSFVIIGFTNNIWLLYVALILFSFAAGTVVSCLTTIISSYGQEDQKGRILGIFRSLGALSRAIGPLLASTVYWCAGATICYSIGAVSLLLPIILLKKYKLAIL